MDDLAAIDAEIDALRIVSRKLNSQMWATLLPYENVYDADMLGALGDRIRDDLANALAIQAEIDSLDEQYSALFAARDLVLASQYADDTGYEGALTA